MNDRIEEYCSVFIVVLLVLLSCTDKGKSEFEKGMKLQRLGKYKEAITVYDSLIDKYTNSIWVDSAESRKATLYAVLYGPDISSVQYLVEEYIYDKLFKIDSLGGTHSVRKSGIEVKDVKIEERFSYNASNDYYPLKIAISYFILDKDASKRVGGESLFTKFFRVNFSKDNYGNWQMISPGWDYWIFLVD